MCVDAGHENFHTATGCYYPFAELLRGDGYRVRETADAFDASSLAPCDVLVLEPDHPSFTPTGRNDGI